MKKTFCNTNQFTTRISCFLRHTELKVRRIEGTFSRREGKQEKSKSCRGLGIWENDLENKDTAKDLQDLSWMSREKDTGLQKYYTDSEICRRSRGSTVILMNHIETLHVDDELVKLTVKEMRDTFWCQVCLRRETKKSDRLTLKGKSGNKDHK